METEGVQLLVQKLVDAIAERIKPVVPFEHQLWTVEDIGCNLKVDANKVVQRYASLLDFLGGSNCRPQNVGPHTRAGKRFILSNG